MKPKLLILTDWFLPGYKAGGPIRSVANLCRELTDDYELFILTGDRDYGDDSPYKGIAANKWSSWEGIAQVWYASPKWLSLASMEQFISSLNPDFVYLNSMFSVKYAVWPVYLLAINKVNSQLVWAPRGMLHKGAIQYNRWRKLVFLSLVRLWGLPGRILFHATDEQEARDISHHLGTRATPSVIANLTHLPESFSPKKNKQTDHLKLGFISRIHPKKNLAFLLGALKEVTISIALTVWGPVEDELYWEECQKRINDLPKHIQVTYGGVLTHQGVEEKLNEIDVFVLPTHGENFGHAIYEAFSHGTPALISKKTPWQGLEKEKAGWDLPLDQEIWTSTLEKVARLSEEDFRLWQTGARAYALKKSQNAELVKEYKNLFLIHG